MKLSQSNDHISIGLFDMLFYWFFLARKSFNLMFTSVTRSVKKSHDGLTRLPLDWRHCSSGLNVSFCYCKEGFLVPFSFSFFSDLKTVQKFLLGNQKIFSEISQRSQLYFSSPIFFPFIILSNTTWVLTIYI